MKMFAVLRIILFYLCVGQIRSLLDGLETGESLRISQLETKVQQLEAALNQVNGQLAKINTQAIAFTAMLSKTIANLGDHQTVVFDSVIANVGNAYSRLDGHFAAPVDGVYAFYVTATNLPHHSVSLYLMKNGQRVNSRVLAHGSPGDDGEYVTSTIAIMLDLRKGDRVWTQNEDTYSPVEELDGGWSYFSGHLIK